MLGGETLAGVTDALTVIGIVLLEAVVLYVGYGALETVLGPRLVDALVSDT